MSRRRRYSCPGRVEEQDPTERPDHDDGQPHERDLGDGPSDAPARSVHRCSPNTIGIVTVSQLVASKQAARSKGHQCGQAYCAVKRQSIAYSSSASASRQPCVLVELGGPGHDNPLPVLAGQGVANGSGSVGITHARAVSHRCLRAPFIR